MSDYKWKEIEKKNIENHIRKHKCYNKEESIKWKRYFTPNKFTVDEFNKYIKDCNHLISYKLYNAYKEASINNINSKNTIYIYKSFGKYSGNVVNPKNKLTTCL